MDKTQYVSVPLCSSITNFKIEELKFGSGNRTDVDILLEDFWGQILLSQSQAEAVPSSPFDEK